MRGVYVLVLRLNKDADIRIGKLGKLRFKSGWYAYAGSARGAGGFKRVMRHFDVASGKNRTRKWHIDYLLPHSDALYAVLMPTGKALECTVAKSLGEFCCEVPRFGCSDCFCRAHLFFAEADIRDRLMHICSELTGNESMIISPHM